MHTWITGDLSELVTVTKAVRFDRILRSDETRETPILSYRFKRITEPHCEYLNNQYSNQESDSLSCNLSCTNGIKNLIGFASLGVK